MVFDKSQLELERKRFELFKSIFDERNKNSEENTDELTKIIEEEIDKALDDSSNIKNIPIIFLGGLLKIINKEFFEIREDDYGITKEYYPYILNQMKQLARELNLTNSLELSNLFTYLLWNGYLSKTKQNVYRIEDRKMIIGLAFADIMDGVGVCLNHADMLKDFLNTCGYNSSTMINLVDKNIKSNYKFDIERKSEKAKKKTEILNLAMCPIMKKIGNHAFTLIEDNNKLYIYDSTNLMLLNVINPYEAEVINGTGINKLHPYLSYMLNNNQQTGDAIIKLFTSENLSSPYTRRDMIFTEKNNMELFKNRKPLIEDFYLEIKPSIVSISEATEKIKIKQKKR